MINILAVTLLLQSCIGDQQVASRNGLIKDFSVDKNAKGCKDSLLMYQSPFDTCVSTCDEGYHPATTLELSETKKDLVANAGSTYDGVDTAVILERVNNSMNICLEDIIVQVRPTNDIKIKDDFCACANGKSDLINNCDAFCATKPKTADSILYVNTTMGPLTSGNTNLGNLHNWCTVQFEEDDGKPQCMLEAFDGDNTARLTVNTAAKSNSFNANINSLGKNKTWVLKLVETGTGPDAQTQEFQIRRKMQGVDPGSPVGALKITPITQYSCLNYGATVDEKGVISRTNYTRVFYYYTSDNMPAAMSAPTTGSTSLTVCHDEIKNPGNDSSTYPRLETVSGLFTMWDKSDVRFVAKEANGGKLTIDKIIEDRLVLEAGMDYANQNLFTQISYANRPTTSTSGTANVPLGFMMTYWTDSDSGRAYCPTTTHYTSGDALFKILGDYLEDTEGLYLGERDPVDINTGTSVKTVYGTMFITESVLLKYGFYINNGTKVKANENTIHNKTIHYYWPINPDADPMIQGTRSLFTVRSPDTLAGGTPTGVATREGSSDKRIGCVPKTGFLSN